MLDEMVGWGLGRLRHGSLDTCGGEWLRLVATRARQLDDGGVHFLRERTGKVLARNSHGRE
jgi:hypothetical protein